MRLFRPLVDVCSYHFQECGDKVAGPNPVSIPGCRGARMERAENAKANSSRLSGVLTDTHFWVPVAVLVAGLLLLSCMR
jgi:hypothetical protein